MAKIREIPVEKIKVGEHDQRIEFDDDLLSGIMTSISRVGLLYPILVKEENDGYLVMDGHTRLEAYRRMGKETIACTIAGVEKTDSAEIAFAGNFFRKDLSPIELASAISDVYKKGDMSLEQIAVGFHRSVNWVQSMIAICDWPADVLQAIHSEAISVSAGANLAIIEDDVYREYLVRQAVENGATARATAAWLQAYRNMEPATEAVEAAPEPGQAAVRPMVPQAPCFCCAQIFPINMMSHVPICGPCVQVVRQVSMS